MALKDKIQNSEIYIIVSEKTGRYMLTEKDHTSIFLGREAAEKFAAGRKYARVEGPKRIDFLTLCEISRQAGAERIDLYNQGTKKEEDIPVLKKKKMNPKLNGAIAHLKETGKKEYLYKLMECKYLVPCRIENSSDIIYAMGKIREDIYTLAFTDLEEFWIWVGDMDWQPLEVTYAGMLRIARRRDIILNIKGNRYVLTKHKLDVIRDYERELKMMSDT